MNFLSVNRWSGATHRISAIQLLRARSCFMSQSFSLLKCLSPFYNFNSQKPNWLGTWLLSLKIKPLSLSSPGEKLNALYHAYDVLPAKSPSDYKRCMRAFARRKSSKRRRDEGTPDVLPLEATEQSLEQESGDFSDSSISEVNDVKSVQQTANIPSRGAVLQACTVTSGLIAALGLIIRQVSHTASLEGLPIHDCSTEVSFGIEMWHLELIMALVVLISSSRYLLLRTWPDFAESTEAANQQVLTSLQLVDYVIVSFFPGVSEELLFRGALQPLFGMNWKSVLLVSSLFGVLHLGNGRKYSFAVWATFVGLVYGYATLLSSSIVVPMASHALNNLVGGILWRYIPKTSN